MSDNQSVKSYTVTLILTIVLGFFGAHRFYVGKVFTGIVFLLTFGLFGFGWIIDIFTVAFGNFTDKTGLFIRPVKQDPPQQGATMATTPEEPTTPPASATNPAGVTSAAAGSESTGGAVAVGVGASGDTATKRSVPTWAWVVGGVVILALIVNAVGGGDDSSPDGAAPTVSETDAPVADATEDTATEDAPDPEPAEETQPAALFEPIVIEGSGNDVIDVPVVTDDTVVGTFTHEGSSNFIVTSYDQSGDRISLLVNEIGSYQGTVPFNFQQSPAELEITASGPWTLTISDLLEQPAYTGSLVTGSGDDVLLVSTDSNRLTATHDGSSNFIILGWGERRSLLVNDIGSYEGTVRLGDAVALEITADGNWTLSGE